MSYDFGFNFFFFDSKSYRLDESNQNDERKNISEMVEVSINVDTYLKKKHVSKTQIKRSYIFEDRKKRIPFHINPRGGNKDEGTLDLSD